MTVLIASGAVPRTISPNTAWNGVASTLNGGKWRFTFTPTLASSNSSYNDWKALVVANDTGGLYIEGPSRSIQLFKNGDATPVVSRAITWTAGQAITVIIDLVAGTNASSITVSGATTGNGTQNFTTSGTYFTTSATLGIGRYPGDTFYDFAGTIGDIDDTVNNSTLAANAGSYAVTGTNAGLTATRLLAAAAAAFVITGTPAGLVGPSTYTLAANAGSYAVAGTNATLSQTRALSASPGTYTITGTNATLSKSAGIELGNHGFVAQIYGAGGTPARVTMSVTAGNAILIGRGGKVSDFATVPTASVGTFRFVAPSEELADWPGYGSVQYLLRNNSGGTNVNFDCNVTSFDEHSVHVTEFKGVNTVHAAQWSQVANGSAGPTQATGTITIDRETVFVLDWWGAHPVGGGDHVVSATLNGVAMTDLGGFTTDNPNGYVQTKRFYLVVSTPGTYSATVSHSPTQGAGLWFTALQPDRVLTADAGSYAITGTAANLAFQRAPFAADSGAFAIAGTDAALSRLRIAAADPGSFAIAGTAAGLLGSHVLDATGGSFAIVGTDADPRRGRVLGADASSYAIAGADAGLLASRVAAAAGGTFAIAGADATLSKTTAGAFTLVADPGAFTITGTPTLGGGTSAGLQGNIMPTTSATLRDHISRLITQLTPRVLERDRFREYRNERDADFVEAAEASPQCFRWFQVRDTGRASPPQVSNTDVTARYVTFEILVAYPQTHRAGPQNALDRDDAMDADEKQLEATVGLLGYQNFNGIAGPQASWVDGSVARAQGTGVDFLLITQTMRFHRAA